MSLEFARNLALIVPVAVVSGAEPGKNIELPTRHNCAAVLDKGIDPLEKPATFDDVRNQSNACITHLENLNLQWRRYRKRLEKHNEGESGFSDSQAKAIKEYLKQWGAFTRDFQKQYNSALASIQTAKAATANNEPEKAQEHLNAARKQLDMLTNQLLKQQNQLDEAKKVK